MIGFTISPSFDGKSQLRFPRTRSVHSAGPVAFASVGRAPKETTACRI